MLQDELNDIMKTNETDGATARPWNVSQTGGIAGDGEAIVINSRETLEKYDGQPMNNGFGKAKANAALIVAAVNSYDALLAVAEAAEAVIKPYDETEREELCEIRDLCAALGKLKEGK